MDTRALETVTLIAALALATPLLTPAAHAAPLGPNWTETLFQVVESPPPGTDPWTVDFDWDAGSPYTIDPNVLEVEDHSIQGLGGALYGTLLELTLPNFYDPLPRKDIRITMTGNNPAAGLFERAGVLSIIGSDAPFGGPAGPSVPVHGSAVSGGFSTTASTMVVTEMWQMFPNPDWETVEVYVPVGFELDSILIETASVPLPGSVWLLGSAIAGIVLVRRRQSD